MSTRVGKGCQAALQLCCRRPKCSHISRNGIISCLSWFLFGCHGLHNALTLPLNLLHPFNSFPPVQQPSYILPFPLCLFPFPSIQQVSQPPRRTKHPPDRLFLILLH